MSGDPPGHLELKLRGLGDLKGLIYGACVIRMLVLHRDPQGHITRLLPVFIHHREVALQQTFENDFSQWDSDGADVVSHTVLSHVDWLIYQVDL